MVQPILHIRSGRRGPAAAIAAISAIVAIFGIAIATGLPLWAAFIFGLLVLLAVGETHENLVQFGSIDEARRELDRLEKEERP